MKTLVWILGDQLLAQHPALIEAQHAGNTVRVVLVEGAQRLQKLPYQRKKLVLLLSAMQHYGARLQAQGIDAVYVTAESIRTGLQKAAQDFGAEQCVCMAAADWDGRHFQQAVLGAALGIPVTVLPNTQFLTATFNPFPQVAPDKPVIMENFYRRMRQHFDVLMEDGGTPAGGQWNYDAQNREPLPRKLHPPAVPVFLPDDLTQQVIARVQNLEGLTGSAEDFGYGVTHKDAAAALEVFIRKRLLLFGTYEDAMSQHHPHLWHSILSPYLNIGLLTPMQMIRAAVGAFQAGEAPINSVEGFVRQILGWREFMYWNYWRLMPALAQRNAWQADAALPAFFWTGETPMNCMHHVLERALQTGYTHHIERLMILTNFATLAGLSPQAVTAWFKAVYIDAYDWVMQTNVMGMGLNADGGIIATKPYIASANYIHRMSDYCAGCAYNPKQRTGDSACPFNLLYWNYLLKHESRLRQNPRLGKNVLGLRHLTEAERESIPLQAAQLLAEL